MIGTTLWSSEEDIFRSREIIEELEKKELRPEQKSKLKSELERLLNPVLNDLEAEVRSDLNHLDPLYRGHLIEALAEQYEDEIYPNEAYAKRFGMVQVMRNGLPYMVDPVLPEEKRKYEPIPKIKVEKIRNIYVCETNRNQVEKIRVILNDFLKRCKSDFPHMSLDQIKDGKNKAELQISKINRDAMEKENLSEMEYMDSQYIQKPQRQWAQVEEDPFQKFNKLKDKVGFKF
jgi:hypothetical protein